MSRAAVYSLIATDSELADAGVTVYGFHSTEIPGPRPFVIPRWDSRFPAFSDVGARRVTVWAYDEGADYERIDTILARVKELLTSAVHVTGADGYVLTQAIWRGDSPDLFDDSYNTIARNAEFDVCSREA